MSTTSIRGGGVHINVSDPTNFKMSEEEKMLHVFGVVLIQQFSLKAGLKRFGRSCYEKRVNSA